MRNILRYSLIVIALLTAFNLFIEPLVEPAFVFFPVKKMRGTPASLGLKYEEIYFKAADGARLNGWFVLNQDSDKIILLLHGNGGNISHRLDLINILHALPANVFIIDYHGYGRSEGYPNEEKLYLAADAAYDYLVREKKYKPEQIVVMGSSLGGVAAIWLAANERVGAVIVQKTFTSLADLAPRMNPLYKRPFVWLRERFDSLSRIRQVTEPILVIHSKKDEHVPFDLGVKLFHAANEPKQLVLLEQGGHNDVYSSAEYLDALRRILHSL
ncbi:MAG: alpha/beta fold hydrolase [Candidatus Saganbacteria bacterium]|nr:alpha/beta fold hydrolase [Candidatus Saganbacteria bacterium]